MEQAFNLVVYVLARSHFNSVILLKRSTKIKQCQSTCVPHTHTPEHNALFFW